MEWNKFKGKLLNITLHENYGMTIDPQKQTPFYEIVFKTGTLIEVYEDGLLLETNRDDQKINIYVPFSSIKCVEIFN
ncbi:MAG: hypothetical protein Kow0098_18390 [Ignavibacteriaceae bacterium]